MPAEQRTLCFLISICLQWLTRFLPSLFCREKYEGLQGKSRVNCRELCFR